MSEQLRHEVYGYSLVFLHGTRYFALAEGTGEPVAGRAFFRKYRDAVAFKRALAEHKMQTKVVRVRAVLELAR